MTERQAWLKAARLLRSGQETYVCYAARTACGFEDSLFGSELPPMLLRMREAASKWAHRLRRTPYQPNRCFAAFEENTAKTQQRRVAFCLRMAEKAAAQAAVKKARRQR